MNSQNCSICGISIFDTPLHRNSPIGEVPADWRCEDCLDHPPNPETKKLVDIIHKGE